MDPTQPQARPMPDPESRSTRIRFDRNEFAGAFGDMGTDIPLLVGMTLAAGLDGTGVLLVFGLLQLATGLVYRMPMPVQPLKAMAALVIAQQAGATTLFGAGLAIGVVMLLLAFTGLLDLLARAIPRCVIRGIQLGLGLQLASVALGRFVPADGAAGFALAGLSFAIIVLLMGNRRVPAALPVILLGLVYAVFRNPQAIADAGFGLRLPSLFVPQPSDILTGFLVLALPQIPLSLGNSVLATKQLAADLFPEREVGVRRIGVSYGLMNLVAPWFGGVPVCHGAGGMAGHFAFGGRTGGSVVIYGLLFILLGLFCGDSFGQVSRAFPLPLLGVILLFEALALAWLVRDTAGSRREFPIAVLVGVLAVGLPYGYGIGLVAGTLLYYLGDRTRLVSPDLK